MSVAWALEQDPRQFARELARAGSDRPAWLAALSGELEAQARTDQLRYVLSAWGLSASEAARLFGVSRQALSKWLARGIPAERVEAVADLAAATDVLFHYLKADRIPAVVRRSAPAIDGASLLGLAERGDTRAVLAAARAMFDVAAVHA